MTAPTLTSSPARKLAHLLALMVQASGITHPLLEEDAGDEIPDGRHIVISASAPEPVDGLGNLPPGIAPMQADVVLAVVQPGIRKDLNTSAGVDELDKDGRRLSDIFRRKLAASYGLLRVDNHRITGEGYDASQVDTAGRVLRVYAVMIKIEFGELSEYNPNAEPGEDDAFSWI